MVILSLAVLSHFCYIFMAKSTSINGVYALSRLPFWSPGSPFITHWKRWWDFVWSDLLDQYGLLIWNAGK